jgi:metal-sulfur cluster biosynthetic enzyme
MPPAALTEATILAALRDCYDPELPCNIVDLGLVYAVAIAPDPEAPGTNIPGVPPRHRVSISVTLTDPERPDHPTDAAAQLTAQIQNRLAAFETVSRSDVTLVRDPPWSPLRISPEGRQRLASHTRRHSAPNQSPLVQIKLQ